MCRLHCKQANQIMSSQTALRDAVLGIAGVCILGFLLPAAVLAWQELRCRCDFIGGFGAVQNPHFFIVRARGTIPVVRILQ